MVKERFIVHVDMDAFFAAIEQRDCPSYRGKPVIIGADPKGGKGRGVVSTCSYEARKFGVHSAMPISLAYQKCPAGIFLPVDMKKYQIVSHAIYELFYAFTPLVELISIDEAFLDITGSWHLFGSPFQTCLLIKEKIKKETGLTASFGLAPTKMAAKIASDLKKPDGMVEVTKDLLLDFLWPLPLRKIWGLGGKAESILNEKGIFTIGDLARQRREEIIALFGKNGGDFWGLAQGIDERTIVTERDIKSISNEITFDKDTSDDEKIKETLFHLCEKVSSRLRQEEIKARTITLKIRLEGFHTYTRVITMHKATNFVDNIFHVVKKLYGDFERGNQKIRLLGIKASGFLSNDFPDSIFIDHTDCKKENIHKALETIKEKFGDNAISRGGLRKLH